MIIGKGEIKEIWTMGVFWDQMSKGHYYSGNCKKYKRKHNLVMTVCSVMFDRSLFSLF